MKLVEAKLTYPNEIFMQPSEEPHPHPFTSRKLCKKKTTVKIGYGFLTSLIYKH